MSQPPPQNPQFQNIPTAHHAAATFAGQSTFGPRALNRVIVAF